MQLIVRDNCGHDWIVHEKIDEDLPNSPLDCDMLCNLIDDQVFRLKESARCHEDNPD